MFSQLSARLISLAMVTPSLTTSGTALRCGVAPSTTLRPFGPSVTLTALATLSTPAARLLRASSLYRIRLPLISGTTARLAAPQPCVDSPGAYAAAESVRAGSIVAG